jgi:hypothetical protein
MIVVGADNEYIPKLLGWETARSMDEALRMAKTTAPPRPDILALHAPPILMAETSLARPRTSIAPLEDGGAAEAPRLAEKNGG